MEAKLIVVGGEAKATEIHLRLPTIIGRGRGATLTLPHPLVSRQHCEIYEADGQLYVRDLGSLNGTFVGNEQIREAPLPPGELLTVGAVTFRAIYGDLLEREKREQEQHTPISQRLAATKTARDQSRETLSEPQIKPGAREESAGDSPRSGSPSTERRSKAAQEKTKWAPKAAPSAEEKEELSDDAAHDVLDEVEVVDDGESSNSQTSIDSPLAAPPPAKSAPPRSPKAPDNSASRPDEDGLQNFLRNMR